MTPLEAARDWIERGFYPVPVPFQSKKPVLREWPKLRILLNDVELYFKNARQNVGILLGDEYGTADLDCDCLQAVAAAGELAPPTGMIFGRLSKPASHYIYRSLPGLSSGTYRDPVDKSMIVELRCLKKDGSSGHQTVVPPSVHVSGESIRFEPGRDGKPGEIPSSILVDTTAKIAAAALLAIHFPSEGLRHNSFLALAGVLVRAGWGLPLATIFHRAIYRALWGSTADLSACDSEVKSTFEKYAAGGEITGTPALAALINGKVVECALQWVGISGKSAIVYVSEWPEITPFLVRQPTPMTSALFPGFLGEMVSAVARATESPIELAGLLGLAAVAAAISRKVVVSPEPGYEEPTNIFTAIAMESGNRKTFVLKSMFGPLIDYEIERWECLEPERKRTISQRKTQELQVEHLRKHLLKTVDDNTPIQAQITELENSMPVIPVLPRLWVQDVTPEQLGVIMAEQGERIALVSDEGGIFELLAGRYNKGVPNLDLFLQAHAGSSVRVDRGSRPAILMRHPALTVAISPQPEVLQSLSSQPGFRGRGLLARFLFGLPTSPLGSRLHLPYPVPASVQATYNSGLRSLLTLHSEITEARNGKPGQWKIKFSPKSYERWKGFQRAIELLMVEGGKLAHIKDWASKLPGAAARIAGIMHCVCVSPIASCQVEVEEMETAVKLAEALIDHAIAVFGLIQRDPVIEDAQYILRWILRQRSNQFTIRDCFCAHQEHFRRVEAMYPAIHLLEQHGYVRQSHELKTNGRPSQIYLLNPASNHYGNEAIETGLNWEISNSVVKK